MKWTCSKCGKVFYQPYKSHEIIAGRGHYWHIPCANFLNKKELVLDFPSDGKLLRDTIMTGLEDKRVDSQGTTG